MEYERSIINVGVVNFKCAAGDKKHNLTNMQDIVSTAAKRGADLLVFPEMCLMGSDHFTNTEVSQAEKIEASETLGGPSVTALAELSQKLGIYMVYGMAEREDGGDTLYNSAVILGPRGLIGSYRKIHPYDNENTWCAKGDKPFLLDTPWGPVGVGVCFDTYHFPELLRYYVYKGARLYLSPTASSFDGKTEEGHRAFLQAYTTPLEAGVIENSVFIASSNLAGKDMNHFYAGGSVVLGPKNHNFYGSGIHYYAGDAADYQIGLHIGMLDLSLSKRLLCTENRITGTPDFRPEIYRAMYEE